MSHVVSTAPPQPIPTSVCPCYQLVVTYATPWTCSPYLVQIQPLSSERVLGTTSDWICSRARKRYTMCTGKCSRFIAVALYPLALLAIICNIVLFFPDGDTKYAKDDHITEEVKYMGGVIGGGVMVLLPALYIHLTGSQSCCANRCGMFLSIAFAAVGVIGGLYSTVVAGLGLQNGPLCKVLLVWTTPFKELNTNYLSDDSRWTLCTAPNNIVPFHIGLFATLLAVSCLEVVLCAIQMINGLFGCLCGTCTDKGPL